MSDLFESYRRLMVHRWHMRDVPKCQCWNAASGALSGWRSPFGTVAVAVVVPVPECVCRRPTAVAVETSIMSLYSEFSSWRKEQFEIEGLGSATMRIWVRIFILARARSSRGSEA